MSDSQQPAVILAGVDDATASEMIDALRVANLRATAVATPAAAVETIDEWIRAGATPPAVVVLFTVDPASARRIQLLSAPTQLVIVASWQDRAAVQRDLRLANIRRGWTFALAEPAVLVDAVRNAARVGDQVRQVRTTLDRQPAVVRADRIDPHQVRELIISDAVLRAVLRDAGDAIIATDGGGRIVMVNAAAAKLFGRGVAELHGLPVGQIIPALGDPGRWAGRTSHHAGSGASGEEIAVDVTVSAVDVTSSPAGYAIVARDARQRLAVEQELRRRAEFTTTIVDGIGDGVYVVDAFGNLLFINPAAERMLGWSREEIISRNMHDTVHRQDHDGRAVSSGNCPLLHAIHAGTPLRTEEIFTCKDGGQLRVESAVTPVKLAGEVIGGVVSFHDISAQYEVRERLNAEKEVLAQMNRAKDDFLAALGHELRTPVTAILGWLQLAIRGELAGEEMTEALEVIEASARTQEQIIGDLLDVSRIISGKLQLRLADCDFNQVVGATVSMLRPQADAKQVSLISEGSTRVVVCGDGARLQQVVWNLLSNAIKFTPAGGEVHVAVETREPFVRLTVRDTGEGIEPELAKTVFDRYVQAPGAERRGGLGIGLAIAKNLVERHGGRISIHSEGRSRGTTAVVELPVAAPESDCETSVAEVS